jgi:hypothetical protein
MISNQSFYRQKSNITTTISIKGNHEQDYLELRDLLSRNRISLGEYLVTAYQELDKGSSAAADCRLRQLRWR